MNGGNHQLVANDSVSKAFEILYTTIVTNARITTDIIIPVDADGDCCFFQNMIFLSNFINRTTGIYLKFLSGVLVSGRKAANDFSNIQSEVMPEFLDMIRAMINHATDEDLGI